MRMYYHYFYLTKTTFVLCNNLNIMRVVNRILNIFRNKKISYSFIIIRARVMLKIRMSRCMKSYPKQELYAKNQDVHQYEVNLKFSLKLKFIVI